ncbi:MAG TPA: MarR family transcriptional regulator [Reyranellaceae bacterium]|nr:MarR family transcriptional regulator [Reyranellaceae bacterium]
MTTNDDATYRFGFTMAEVSRLWRHVLDARLKPLGLSTARWVALVNLSAHPEGMTQNQLAIRVGIKGSTLVRQLDLLEADGWVERRGEPGDRRAKRVFMTAKAKPVLAQIARVGRDLRRELLQDASEAEIRAALTLLEGVRRRLQPLATDERLLPQLEAAE